MLDGWTVFLAEERIRDLAGVDLVKWIEAGPPPIRLYNDGVRGPNGVDSDAVAPPEVYALDGTGVVLSMWEGTNASIVHADLEPRVVIGDLDVGGLGNPALPWWTRSIMHDESLLPDGQYNFGEGLYVDIDDGGTITAGDIRGTAPANPAGLPAWTTVVATDADAMAASSLTFFQKIERFSPDPVEDWIYRDLVVPDPDEYRVEAGDLRLTPVEEFAAGTTVLAGAADEGRDLLDLPTNPHAHATHVAGTVLGDGTLSEGAGGWVAKWRGVAPAAQLRTYRPEDTWSDDYVDAAGAGATLSTNSWGYIRQAQWDPPNLGYVFASAFYDTIVSGVKSDGKSSELTEPLTILAAAGNEGRPERFVDGAPQNGLYDPGESIYLDRVGDGDVDFIDVLLTGPGAANGTALSPFRPNVRFFETTFTEDGYYADGDAIYVDLDESWTVSDEDLRVIDTGAYAAGSTVLAGDADEVAQLPLRGFAPWNRIGYPNSAKDVLTVGAIQTNDKGLSYFSSRGPTNDGRLKPDLAGPGSQKGGDGGVTSTWPDPDQSYESIQGTSMATPAVAGAAALLTQWYRKACGSDPLPAALRALLVHGAEDLLPVPIDGDFPGPDFAYGYGRASVGSAADLMARHVTDQIEFLADKRSYSITIGEMQELKVTLAWDDPAWTPNAAADPVTGILQNDLDLVLFAPDGTRHAAWKLDPTQPALPATKVIVPSASPLTSADLNHRDTIEQVVASPAMGGTWRLQVSASNMILEPQSFALVCEALPPQLSVCLSTPGADVRMKDNAADTGAVPTSGKVYRCPDYWNRNAPDGVDVHQNPIFGQDNYLYVRIRNDGTEAVHTVTVDGWLAAAATGLAWPENFAHAATFTAPNLAPGEVRILGPVVWDPPSPSPSDHFCFYVRATSPQDPITIVEGSSISTNVKNSNNIAWRNVNVVDLSSSRTITFIVRHIGAEPGPVELQFQVPPAFLTIGEATIALPHRIEASWLAADALPAGLAPGRTVQVRPWNRDATGVRIVNPSGIPARPGSVGKDRPRNTYRLLGERVLLRGPQMMPGDEFTVQLTFFSDQKEQATYDVFVDQLAGGQPVGGIQYSVRTGFVD